MQRHAADLLYALCDQDSVETIVEQLIDFLRHSEYNIREELVRGRSVELILLMYPHDLSGAEDCNPCREVCPSILVVRRRHAQARQDLRRLCPTASLVPRHPSMNDLTVLFAFILPFVYICDICCGYVDFLIRAKVVVNRQEVQDYAAKTCFEALLDPSAHETMVCPLWSYLCSHFFV